jgi:hypothetical protein
MVGIEGHKAVQVAGGPIQKNRAAAFFGGLGRGGIADGSIIQAMKHIAAIVP